MEREQIIEDFIGEMQEKALSELMQEGEEYRKLCEESLKLSEQIQEFLEKQKEDVRGMFEEYYDVRAKMEVLNNDCLYRQVMKDAVRLQDLIGLS